MGIAAKNTYLLDLIHGMNLHWPESRTINIVFHGHSVPAGYFVTPVVDTFNAYPYLIHRRLKERFPFAVINVIVTAVGGETSDRGAARFREDVLCHKPDIIVIDYGLNDRGIGPEKAEAFWRMMIESGMEIDSKIVLMTPTMDIGGDITKDLPDLNLHAVMTRKLADEYSIALADSYKAFKGYINGGGELWDLLCWGNHPNRKGHELIRDEFMRWFPLVY